MLVYRPLGPVVPQQNWPPLQSALSSHGTARPLHVLAAASSHEYDGLPPLFVVMQQSWTPGVQ
jgi:hypothetical protein